MAGVVVVEEGCCDGVGLILGATTWCLPASLVYLVDLLCGIEILFPDYVIDTRFLFFMYFLLKFLGGNTKKEKKLTR